MNVHVPGLWRVRAARRWWVNRHSGPAIVLLYHRIAEAVQDPQLLCVSPSNFADHLRILRKAAHPLSVERMASDLSKGKVCRRGVAITFDDGYADNLIQARPLLTKFRVPATVFVATGQLRREREFWWDDLARILLTTSVLPAELEMSVGGERRRWRFDKDATRSDGNESWNVHMPACSARQAAYCEIASLLKGMRDADRHAILRTLEEWAGIGTTVRPAFRTCTAAEVRELAKGRLITVGAHTVCHQPLSLLPASEQRAEIEGSKAALEQILGKKVSCFSYPYGTRADYTETAVRFVSEAGFTSACSNFPGHVARGVDPFQLPRFLVRNWTGEEFARRIESWFGERWIL